MSALLVLEQNEEQYNERVGERINDRIDIKTCYKDVSSEDSAM